MQRDLKFEYSLINFLTMLSLSQKIGPSLVTIKDVNCKILNQLVCVCISGGIIVIVIIFKQLSTFIRIVEHH